MKEYIKIAASLDFLPPKSQFFNDADIIILGRKCFPLLSYKKELKGEEENISAMSGFSRNFTAPVFIALKTDNYGQIKQSVAVFERGRLLSISDATFDKSGKNLSTGIKVCKTSIGKIGVLVSEDISNPALINALSLCESRIIINMFGDIYDFDREKLIPTLSYLYGIPIISCGLSGIIACDYIGSVKLKTDKPRASGILNTTRTIKIISKKTTARF